MRMRGGNRGMNSAHRVHVEDLTNGTHPIRVHEDSQLRPAQLRIVSVHGPISSAHRTHLKCARRQPASICCRSGSLQKRGSWSKRFVCVKSVAACATAARLQPVGVVPRRKVRWRTIEGEPRPVEQVAHLRGCGDLAASVRGAVEETTAQAARTADRGRHRRPP